MGLPAQAKGTTPTPAKLTPIASSKTGAPTTAATTASPTTPAKKQTPATSSTETKTDKKTASLTSKSSSSMTSQARNKPHSSDNSDGGRLARVTAYWAGEGDYYTGRCISSTGVHLHDGHCAVDPRIIPYGSVVKIAGVGTYLAVDTGSAVISREAAKEAGHTSAERNALVIDIFFESRRDGERFAAAATRYAAVSWTTPTASNQEAKNARSFFADEDWGRIHSKQL